MGIPTNAIHFVQKRLLAAGGTPVASPGTLDATTAAAIAATVFSRKSEIPSKYRARVLAGDARRKATALIQLFCADANIDPGPVDGLWGPSTENAFDALAYLHENGALPEPWRDDKPSAANPHGWPKDSGAAMIKFYGNPGTNQTSIALPYPHYLAWDTSVKTLKMTCHAKVAASVQSVLAKALAHYGADGIRDLRLDIWGGTLNVRKKRGGTAWSTHAWGAALDYDPDNNKLAWGRDRATFARPAYREWFRFWEEEGWVSLGRSRNFDWMHVQAARLP